MGHLLPHATQTPSLFDHLVGAHQNQLWDRQAEIFGGRKIDDEFEVSGCTTGRSSGLAPRSTLTTTCATCR